MGREILIPQHPAVQAGGDSDLVCTYQCLCHQLCLPMQSLPCWEVPLGITAIERSI